MPGLRTCPRRPASAFATLALALACSSDDPIAPDPEIAFLVGDWDATRFEIGVNGAPEESFDLIEEGATFTLNVQPSGQYTAILTIPGFPSSPPELGTLSVDGDELLFRRTSPPPATTTRAAYERLGDDRIQFGGPSELDIDGDGTAESITLDVEIVRDD